jgi:hypothetical protein
MVAAQHMQPQEVQFCVRNRPGQGLVNRRQACVPKSLEGSQDPGAVGVWQTGGGEQARRVENPTAFKETV